MATGSGFVASGDGWIMKEFDEKYLDTERTVAGIAYHFGRSESSVRRWLKTFGDRLSVGYTRPRRYWLAEQEAIRDQIEGRGEMKTVASRNAMDSHYNFRG